MHFKHPILFIALALIMSGCSMSNNSIKDRYKPYYSEDLAIDDSLPKVEIDKSKAAKLNFNDDIIKAYQLDFLSGSKDKEVLVLSKTSSNNIKFSVFNSSLSKLIYSNEAPFPSDTFDFNVAAIMPLEDEKSHRIVLLLEYFEGNISFTKYALIDGGEEVKIQVDNLFSEDAIGIEYGHLQFNLEGFSISRLGSHFDAYRFYLGSVQDAFKGLKNYKEDLKASDILKGERGSIN